MIQSSDLDLNGQKYKIIKHILSTQNSSKHGNHHFKYYGAEGIRLLFFIFADMEHNLVSRLYVFGSISKI
jgi:hypothetical protein